MWQKSFSLETIKEFVLTFLHLEWNDLLNEDEEEGITPFSELIKHFNMLPSLQETFECLKQQSGIQV